MQKGLRDEREITNCKEEKDAQARSEKSGDICH